MQAEEAVYTFLLDNLFFADIDAPEVQKGRVNATLTVKKSAHAFEMNFHFEGKIVVPCDRCLDDMDLPIATDERLVVKFGKEYTDLGDNLIVIPEEEGALNVAWFMYEFIALAIPLKHVHAPGGCNKIMSRKLGEHLCYALAGEKEEPVSATFADADAAGYEEEEEEGPGTDSRWNELRKLLDNN